MSSFCCWNSVNHGNEIIESLLAKLRDLLCKLYSLSVSRSEWGREDKLLVFYFLFDYFLSSSSDAMFLSDFFHLKPVSAFVCLQERIRFLFTEECADHIPPLCVVVFYFMFVIDSWLCPRNKTTLIPEDDKQAVICLLRTSAQLLLSSSGTLLQGT